MAEVTLEARESTAAERTAAPVTCRYCAGEITDRRYFVVRVDDGEPRTYHEGCWRTMPTPDATMPA